MKSWISKRSLRARIDVALWRSREDATTRAGDPDRPHVFVALAADYGNLGDLAITHAQVKFLEHEFPDSVVEAIPISRTLPAIKRLRRVIRGDDIITLIGGGNTGDMYDDIQYLRELFITNFPRNRIISFPQTIEFSHTAHGRWAERRARKVYNAHPHLTVMARDSRSYERALGLFLECRVVLAPDVVLTLDKSEPAESRDGVLVALRSDLERGLSAEDHAALISTASQLGNVRERDTHIGDVRLTPSQTLGELEEFWKDCRASELVVTDRLHGMIFSVITGTPSLALDSGTGKVARFHRDWLADLPGVELVGDPCDIAELAPDLVPLSAPDRAALRKNVRTALALAIRPEAARA